MNTAAQTLIHLDGVTKVFFTDEVETHALAGIHLEIKSGEYIAIAGPSGCGKSTLLSILGLLDSPTEGKYTLNGKSVADLPLSERARVRNREIGFIFQSFNLIGDLNVYENVELPLTYRGMKSAERKERVMAALEKVGMAHRAKHLPSQLSGGQQQRVAVARAVAGAPSILLADEPTGNLDSKNGEAVMELLRELHREGATICMVTHDPRYARHADRTHPPLRRPRRRGRRQQARREGARGERLPDRALRCSGLGTRGSDGLIGSVAFSRSVSRRAHLCFRTCATAFACSRRARRSPSSPRSRSRSASAPTPRSSAWSTSSC